jgi:hypothetical protein
MLALTTKTIIFEFSTGINIQTDGQGKWWSVGDRGGWMHNTYDPDNQNNIPYAIAQAYNNKEFAVGDTDKCPFTVMARIIRGQEQTWSVVAFLTHDRDNINRRVPTYRFFFGKGSTAITEILRRIITFEAQHGNPPLFDPFQATDLNQYPPADFADIKNVIGDDADMTALVQQEPDIKTYVLQPSSCIVNHSNALSLFRLHRLALARVNMINIKAKEINKKPQEVSVSWAYNADVLQRPETFILIQAANVEAYDYLNNKRIAEIEYYDNFDEQGIRSALKGLIERENIDKTALTDLKFIANAIQYINDNDVDAEQYIRSIAKGLGLSRYNLFTKPQFDAVKLHILMSLYFPNVKQHLGEWEDLRQLDLGEFVYGYTQKTKGYVLSDAELQDLLQDANREIINHDFDEIKYDTDQVDSNKSKHLSWVLTDSLWASRKTLESFLKTIKQLVQVAFDNLKIKTQSGQTQDYFRLTNYLKQLGNNVVTSQKYQWLFPNWNPKNIWNIVDQNDFAVKKPKTNPFLILFQYLTILFLGTAKSFRKYLSFINKNCHISDVSKIKSQAKIAYKNAQDSQPEPELYYDQLADLLAQLKEYYPQFTSAYNFFSTLNQAKKKQALVTLETDQGQDVFQMIVSDSSLLSELQDNVSQANSNLWSLYFLFIPYFLWISIIFIFVLAFRVIVTTITGMIEVIRRIKLRFSLLLTIAIFITSCGFNQVRPLNVSDISFMNVEGQIKQEMMKDESYKKKRYIPEPTVCDIINHPNCEVAFLSLKSKPPSEVADPESKNPVIVKLEQLGMIKRNWFIPFPSNPASLNIKDAGIVAKILESPYPSLIASVQKNPDRIKTLPELARHFSKRFSETKYKWYNPTSVESEAINKNLASLLGQTDDMKKNLNPDFIDFVYRYQKSKPDLFVNGLIETNEPKDGKEDELPKPKEEPTFRFITTALRKQLNQELAVAINNNPDYKKEFEGLFAYASCRFNEKQDKCLNKLDKTQKPSDAPASTATNLAINQLILDIKEREYEKCDKPEFTSLIKDKTSEVITSVSNFDDKDNKLDPQDAKKVVQAVFDLQNGTIKPEVKDKEGKITEKSKLTSWDGIIDYPAPTDPKNGKPTGVYTSIKNQVINQLGDQPVQGCKKKDNPVTNQDKSGTNREGDSTNQNIPPASGGGDSTFDDFKSLLQPLFSPFRSPRQP